MSYTYDDIEQITMFLNKQSGGVGNIYAHAANMLEELAKDRARLEQRVKDLEDQISNLNLFNTQHACETVTVGGAQLTTFTTQDREEAERAMKNPYEYAAMLRNSARFNPTMGILAECADMVEFLADELCNSDHTFENGEPFKNKYARSWQK